MRSVSPTLPFALLVSAAAGLAVGWELRRIVGAYSTQPVGSRLAREHAAARAMAHSSVRAAADAAAAWSRDDFTAFLEALDFTPPADLERLWDTLTACPGSEHQRYLDAFMDRCAEIAPERGLQFLDRRTGEPAEREKARTEFFVAWASYHPVEAIRAAASWPEGAGRESLLRALAAATAKDHPEIFFQEREALRGAGSPVSSDPFLVTPPETLPEAAITASAYDSSQAGALCTLTRRNPALAMKLWVAMDDDEKRGAGRIVARGRAESDPGAAEAWVRAWPKVDERASGLHQIANALAKSDPARAGALLAETHSYENDPKGPDYGKLAAYTSYSYLDLGPSAVEIILQRLLGDDPAAAQDWARRYLPVQADYQVGRALAAALPSDVDAAMVQLTQLDAPALAEAVGPVAGSWQPQGVLDRLEELVQRFPEDRRDVGRALLLASAVGREPEDVIVAAASLPEGESRETVLKEAFSGWLNRSPTEATAWLGAAPASPERDHIIYRVTAQLAEIDPAGAWAWLLTTADGSPRNTQLFEVAEEWGRRDAKAARTAIEALTMDAELKADMLKNALRPNESQETEAPGPTEDASR